MPIELIRMYVHRPRIGGKIEGPAGAGPSHMAAVSLRINHQRALESHLACPGLIDKFDVVLRQGVVPSGCRGAVKRGIAIAVDRDDARLARTAVPEVNLDVEQR